MERDVRRNDFAYLIANSLTMARAGIGTAIAISSSLGVNEYITPLLTFGVVTDVLDGPIARQFNGTSPDGPWRDLLADVILITSAIGYAYSRNLIPPEAAVPLLGLSAMALFIRTLKYSLPTE